MRHRAWVWLLVVPVAVFSAVVVTSPFVAFHPQLTFAGRPDRFVETVVRAGRSDARAALWLDNLFWVSWLLTVPRLLRVGLERWAPEGRRMVAVWMASPRLAVAAGAWGLAGNALALFAAGKSQPPALVTWAIAVIGMVTVALVVVVVVALAVLVVGPTGAHVMRRSRSG